MTKLKECESDYNDHNKKYGAQFCRHDGLLLNKIIRVPSSEFCTRCGGREIYIYAVCNNYPISFWEKLVEQFYGDWYHTKELMQVLHER